MGQSHTEERQGMEAERKEQKLQRTQRDNAMSSYSDSFSVLSVPHRPSVFCL